MQSYHLLDDRSSPNPFWTEVQGWYNPTTFSMTKVTLDLFWTIVQGWYNPSTLSMTEVHRIRFEPKSKDDTILPPSWWPKLTGSVLNQSSRMIQSYHFLEDRSHWIHYGHMSQDDAITGSILNQGSWMIQSYHLLDDRSSPNPFWTEFQGWYNPTTFLRTKVTGSIMDICPGMIQSLFILEDQGLRVTFGHVPRYDTIPLQDHYSPFWGRSFRTIPSLSRKCSNSTRGRGFVGISSSKPSSSTSSIYKSIAMCFSSMWILKASSSISSV